MIEVYKYTHGIYDVADPPFNLDISRTRGHSFKLIKRRCNTSLRLKFFSYRVINVWNGLPDEIVSAFSLNVFKNKLDAHWSCYKFHHWTTFPCRTDICYISLFGFVVFGYLCDDRSTGNQPIEDRRGYVYVCMLLLFVYFHFSFIDNINIYT